MIESDRHYQTFHLLKPQLIPNFSTPVFFWGGGEGGAGGASLSLFSICHRVE